MKVVDLAVVCVAFGAACRSESNTTQAAPTAPAPTAPAPTAPTPDAGIAADLRSVFDRTGAGSGSGSGADPLAKLKAIRDTAPGPDQALLDQGIAALTEIQAATSDRRTERAHLLTGTKLFVAWMPALADRLRDDVAASRMVISTWRMTAYQIENMGLEKEIPVAPILQETLERMRAMTRRFPTDAGTWRMLAFALEDMTEDEMRAFATCAKLDPTLDCGEKLARLRADYVLPYCEGADIRPELAWREGLDHAAPGAVAMADPYWNGDGSLYVLPATRFGAKDVRIVQNRMGTDHEPYVTLRLRHGLADAYSAWIDELQNRHAFAVTVVGTTLLGHLHNHSMAIPVRERALTFFRAAKIEDLCAKTRTRTLPADL